MGTGFSKKKKQAKKLQEQFAQLQEKMKNTEVEGTSGNGLVTITLNGENDMLKIAIKPECADPEDIEGLEDLVKAAYNDANKKLREQQGSGGGGMPDLGNLEGFGF